MGTASDLDKRELNTMEPEKTNNFTTCALLNIFNTTADRNTANSTDDNRL